MYNTLNNPSAHPSYSHYYLLSPSTLFFFFVQLIVFAHLIVFCTSYCFLHILLFCTFLFHCTFYSYFSFFTIYMPLCCVTLYNFYFYYFALSTERTWFDYISLLIIPCIIYYVTNKETLIKIKCNFKSFFVFFLFYSWLKYFTSNFINTFIVFQICFKCIAECTDKHLL